MDPIKANLNTRHRTMSAVQLDCGKLTVNARPLPKPRPDECVVKVHQAGICGTDLALARGLYGFHGVPGHEFVGHVIGGARPLMDRRVVANINLSCGRCDLCARQQRSHCQHRRVLGLRGAHGAFAEYVIVPAANLHPVPDAISDDEAVFAEPLAAALSALDAAQTQPYRQVLVVGAGRLGQLIVRVFLSANWRVDCVSRSSASVGRLPGAVQVVEASSTTAQYDVVIDASGAPAGLQCAFDAVRARGMLIVKSTLAEPLPIDLNRLVVDEIRILGSRCGAIEHALMWLSSQRHDLARLITHRFALHDVEPAFAASATSQSCKVLLTPSRSE